MSCYDLRKSFDFEQYSNDGALIWEVTDITPFNMAIISWEGKRPTHERVYRFQVSVFIDEWTPWIDYAYWSSTNQHTFSHHLSNGRLSTDQDIILVNANMKGTGCRVRLKAEGPVYLENIIRIHLSAIDRDIHKVDLGSLSYFEHSIHLDVPGLSQIALNDERRQRLCSPTSLTAVIRYLTGTSHISPLNFADAVLDTAFDIYGNWVLNTAQAAHELGERWRCFPAFLRSFDQILERLGCGIPVIVSVKGPLRGGAFSYESGHLLVVKGFDPKEKRVYCMDPAFSTDRSTSVDYDLQDFINAWRRRFGVAYMVLKTS